MTPSQPKPHPGRDAPEPTLAGAPPCLQRARGCFQQDDTRRCPACDGDDYHLEPCDVCHGTGDVPHPCYGHRSCPVPTVPCPACYGEPDAARYWLCQECGYEED